MLALAQSGNVLRFQEAPLDLRIEVSLIADWAAPSGKTKQLAYRAAPISYDPNEFIRGWMIPTRHVTFALPLCLYTEGRRFSFLRLFSYA